MDRRLYLVIAAALAACKHGHGDGSGGGHAGVHLFVDHKAAGVADAAAAARWAPLAELLPANARDAATWRVLEVHTKSGRATTLPQPATAQPGLVAALFPGKDGVDFGMFAPEDLAKHGVPKLVETEPSDVRIETTTGGEGASGGGDGECNGANRASAGTTPELAGVKLTIKQKSGDIEITGDDLGKMTRVPPPTGDTSNPGWDVAAVLAAKNIKPTGKVVLTDDSGATVSIAAADLDPKKSVAFMKVNKKGEIRFRLFEKNAGGAWDVAGELRGVTTIELTP